MTDESGSRSLPLGRRRGDVKRLQGREGYRMRVSRYRVLFADDGATVLAVYIGKRETTTYRWEAKMGKPVMFKTPSGEKMVVLALADYEELVARADDPEDVADVAAFDEALASLERGEDRVLSANEMEAFYARPGFLRGLRTGKRMTQAALAAKAGVTQGFLSDIEAGRRKASPETLAKIRGALGVAQKD